MISGGPNIETDGLVMCLDASDDKSYSGNGNIWIDRVNNIQFESKGTIQTPFIKLGGTSCMKFNNSGYWESLGGTDQSDKVDMGGDCTLIMWLYSEGVTERNVIFEKDGIGDNSYQREIAVTWESSNQFTYYSRKNNYDFGQTTNLDLNKWTMMAIKMSNGRTSTPRTGFYSKNGDNWISNYTSRSSSALESAGVIRIGSGYVGPLENGAISVVLCYNKMLNDEEILNNYNTYKSRFGH